jgi:hypothetical protein
MSAQLTSRILDNTYGDERTVERVVNFQKRITAVNVLMRSSFVRRMLKNSKPVADSLGRACEHVISVVLDERAETRK